MNRIRVVGPIVFLCSIASFCVLSNAFAEEVHIHPGPSGGIGGAQFDTGDAWPVRLTEVNVRAGDYIDAIGITQVRPDGTTIPPNMFGGGGGSPSSFQLGADERITWVGGKYGQFVDSLTVKTNQGRSMTWGGGGGVVNYSYSAPPGCFVEGFWGRAGDYIDAIGVKLSCTGP